MAAVAKAQRNLRGGRTRKRAAVWLCFLAGFLLTLVSFLSAIVYRAGDAALFSVGVNRYVVAYGILSQADGDAFAAQTMAYLNGERSDWAPQVRYTDHALAIPQAFTTHMATVRGWLRLARTALPLAAVTAVGLAALGFTLSGRRGARRFPLGWYVLGLAFPLLLALGMGLWGSLDFSGLWSWLHHAFILDGIFSAQEEIMRLFPLELFAAYIAPVGVTFGLFAGASLALPPIALGLRKIAKRLWKKDGTVMREA